MSQEKAQLIAPIGIMTVSGVTATGVITATSFSGNIVGSAKSLVNGADVTVGVMTATSLDGNLTGNIQRLADSAPNISAGVSTATSFVGNLTGSVTDLTSAPAITVGLVTASGLEGNITGNVVGNVVGNVTGNVTGTISGDVTGNVTGNATGIADGLAGGLGVNYNGGWTGAGTSQITAGVITATTFYGDGSTLDGVSSGPVSQQSIGITSATTSIDLSNGNLIHATQSANTTVSFASTANGNVYFIRKKDDNTTARTITWPDRIKWNGGTAPTLISDSVQNDVQVFLLVTRDMGVTWYGKEVFKLDNIQGYPGFAFGIGTYGMLGTNNDDSVSSPKQVGGDTDWNAVSQGVTQNGYFFLFVKSDGGLYGVGRNDQRSQLGQNSRTYNYSSPIQIGTDTNWSGNITGGVESAAAVKTTGELFVWGNNEHGMLGLNDRTHRSSPTQLPGTTWSTAHNTLATHTAAMVAIKTDGTLWSWGYNLGNQGRLGQGNNSEYSSPTQVGTDTTWATVAHNGTSGAAIKTNGTLWTWGYNEDSTGQSGQNNQTNYSSPKQVGTDTTWSSISGSGSGRFRAAIKTDGTLWTWGRNNYGQLGAGDSGNASSATARSSPLQIGTDTTWWQVRVGNSVCHAVKTDGTLWSWGHGSGGAMGTNTPDNMDYSSPTQVGTDTNWKTTEYGFGQSSSSTFILRSS